MSERAYLLAKSQLVINGQAVYRKITNVPRPVVHNMARIGRQAKAAGAKQPLKYTDTIRTGGKPGRPDIEYKMFIRGSEEKMGLDARRLAGRVQRKRMYARKATFRGKATDIFGERRGSYAVDARPSAKVKRHGFIRMDPQSDRENMRMAGRPERLIPNNRQIRRHELRHLSQPLSNRKGQDKAMREIMRTEHPNDARATARTKQLVQRSEAWADLGSKMTSGHVSTPEDTLTYLRTRRKMSTGILGRPDRPTTDLRGFRGRAVDIGDEKRISRNATQTGRWRRWQGQQRAVGKSYGKQDDALMSERAYLAWRGERETEITKLFNVRNMRAPIRRVADTRIPLGPGEYYHGTTKRSAKAIRQGGFQLADPRSTKHRGADAMIRGDKTVRNTSTMSDRGREGQKVRSRTGRPIASGDMGPGVYVTEDADFAGGMAHMLGSKRKMNPKLLNREGTRLGEVMRVKVRGATASGPNPRGPRQGLKREGGMPFGRMTPKAAKEGYVGVDAGGGLLNGPHQVAVGNPRDVIPVHTPKRWAAGWTPGEYEAAAYGTAGTGAVGMAYKKERDQKRARAQAVARRQQRRKVSGRR